LVHRKRLTAVISTLPYEQPIVVLRKTKTGVVAKDALTYYVIFPATQT
jgi:hypothetical protein